MASPLFLRSRALAEAPYRLPQKTKGGTKTKKRGGRMKENSTTLKDGRELDGLIAEKVFDLIVSNGFILEARAVRPGEKIKPNDPVPKYSTDREAMMLVVNSMLGRNDKASARFSNALGFVSKNVLKGSDTPVWTDSLEPFQVCVAALKALEP